MDKRIRRIYSIEGNEFRGNKSKQWPKKRFIPWVEGLCKKLELDKQLKVVHFYVHPTSVRLVCAVGDFEFHDPETKKELKNRDNYLDKFKTKRRLK
jgi:hypothetical protein